MKIRIFYIGKDKKNHQAQAEQLYLDRIKHYMPIEIIQIKPGKYSSSLSASEIKDKEEKLFEKALGTDSRVVLLDEGGKLLDSKKFAKFVETQTSMGGKTINFIIGGAYGFSHSMKQKYKTIISLSPLTFAHHLARVILVEQLYRAMTILNNEPYHNS